MWLNLVYSIILMSHFKFNMPQTELITIASQIYVLPVSLLHKKKWHHHLCTPRPKPELRSKARLHFLGLTSQLLTKACGFCF